MSVPAHHVRAVQTFYPRIYLACHVNHVRRRTSPINLTAGEATVLAHLDLRRPTRASLLAQHLGIAKSSLSATIKRLTTLGYVARTADSRDRRAAGLQLTPAGDRAMQAGSVLETERVAAMLARLTASQRACALQGLELLARAADALPGKSSTRIRAQQGGDR